MKHRLLYTLALLFATLQTFAQSANHYTYDELNRLTSVTYANGTTVNYTYDAVGNRISKTVTSIIQVPNVTTATVSNVGFTSATCGGNITSAGASAVTARGVCWSTNQNPTVNGNHTSDGTGTGSFTSSITGLTPNTTYYVRAYATNSAGTAYGAQRSFTTPCNSAPNVTISGNTSISSGQSTTLTASGASTYLWSNGSTGNSITVSPAGTTTYTVTGTNSDGCTGTASVTVTVEGGSSGSCMSCPDYDEYWYIPLYTWDYKTFTIGPGDCHIYQIPINTLYTYTFQTCCEGSADFDTELYLYDPDCNLAAYNNDANGTTQSSIVYSNTGSNRRFLLKVTGHNSASGTYTLAVKKECIAPTITITGNTTIAPGQSITLTASGASTYSWSDGSTSSSITVSPTSTSTYTVTGSLGNCGSSTASVTVTVMETVSQPTVTTAAVSNVGSTSATCGGNVTDDGGATVTVRGICWSTSQNPTTSDAHTSDGTGTGAFTSAMTGLTPNTTYYVRAYATNSAGTVYGTQRTFNTECNTVNVSISGNTTITYGQSTTLTASGANSYSWSTGSTNSNITVSPNSTTTYTVTGTNSYGCTATASVTVSVGANLPTVTTAAVNNIGSTSATCGGNVTADGGSTLTSRGICWSTSQNPTTSDAHTSDGTGTGAFTSAMTGLTPNTTYYVRAYATNSAGTSYGGEVMFTTTACNAINLTLSGNTDICEFEPVFLTATIETNGFTPENVHYTWYENGQIRDNMAYSIGANEYAEYWYPRDEPYRFSVKVSYGSDVTCVAQSEEYLVYVHAMPNTTIVTMDNVTICEGGSTTFQAVVDGDYDNITFQWYKNDILLPDETNDILNISNLTIGMDDYYTVVAQSVAGCANSTSFDISSLITVVTTSHTEVSETVCDSYSWNDSVYTQSGDYTQTFTAANGCDSVVTLHLTINPSPSVTISGGSIDCAGNSTTLTAIVTPGQDASYVWYKDGAEMTFNTPSISITDAGAYTVEATVNGCSSFSEPIVVTVGQTSQLYITATETTLCPGGSTVITAEATAWNYNDVAYSWSMGNISEPVYIFSPDHAGTFPFTVTATNTITGCQAIASININVNNDPATPIIAVDNATIIESGQVTLSVTNPVPNAIYSWYKNGELIPYATQANLVEYLSTVNGNATVYTYTVIATLYNSGCVSAFSDNTNVTVFPTPIANVSVNGNTTLCEGSSTTLHVDVTPTYFEYTYQWYLDDIPIPGATTANYVVTEPSRETPYNFFVVVSANSSYNFSVYAPAITIVASPVVTAIINDDVICSGGTATLTAFVNGDVADMNDYNLEWYRNTPISTELVGTGSSYITGGSETPDNYTYWVTANNSYGCNASSNPITLSVVTDPQVDITVADGYPTTVCSGGSTAITANAIGGHGEISYQWYKNGSILVGETNQTLAINNLYHGVNETYTVVVSQTGVGCSNSVSADINTLVAVYPAYSVDIISSGNICEGGALTLTADINNVILGDVLNYQWHEILNGQDMLIDGANLDTYTTSNLQLGNQYDYYVVVNSSFSSCSAISTSHAVNVNVISYTTLYENSCEEYFWNGTTYTETGNYTQTFTAANSCDSVVTLHLTIKHATHNAETETACESFTWNGATYTASGDYTYSHTGANGCTQVDTLHLIILNPMHTAVTESACESFTWNGTTYTNSGDYIYSHEDANGCTQVDTLHLTIHKPVHTAVTENACESFTWNGTMYTTSGDYTYSHEDANGCTQVDTLHLTIYDTVSYHFSIEACGQYMWNGSLYTSSGDYTQTFMAVTGCDSIVTLHLTINPIPEVVITGNTIICPGGGTMLTANGADSYLWSNGSTNSFISVNVFGIYSVTGTSAAGCFNTASATVLVAQPPVITISGFTDLCAGDTTIITAHGGTTYLWSNGSTDSVLMVSDAGVWQVIGYDENGCNSMANVNVNIWQPYISEFSVNVCNSYTWNDLVYTLSGDYTQIFQTVHGCDSVVTLHLTVNQPTSGDTTAVACDSFTWQGITYTESNDYTTTLSNATGCDSVVTLHLTITNTVHTDFTDVECDSYTWNGETYTASGDYTQTFTNAAGCDSVVTLHLTITNTDHTDFTDVACDSYTWNGETYTVSGDYTQTFTNTLGCDSVVTLHLTIMNTDHTDFTDVAYDSYTWNGETYTASGDYTQTFTNAAGCDSVVTLHLTLTVGLNDHDGFDFKVYPNPTNNIVNVECIMHNEELGNAELHLCDAYGRLLEVVWANNYSPLRTVQIDLSRYANGVYFVKLIAEDKTIAVRKVVKQ